MEKNNKVKKKSNQAKEEKPLAGQGRGLPAQGAKKSVQELLGKLKQGVTRAHGFSEAL